MTMSVVYFIVLCCQCVVSLKMRCILKVNLIFSMSLSVHLHFTPKSILSESQPRARTLFFESSV